MTTKKNVSTKEVKETQEQEVKVIKFKVISVKNKKKDGSTYEIMKTILKDPDGNEIWLPVRFGQNVNEKALKGKNYCVSARNVDVKLPFSYKPYEKDGKMKYPYVWVEDIIDYVPLVSKAPERAVTTQDVFSITDEDVYTPDDVEPFGEE